MSERQVVPVGLADLPPGPGLAAVLAGLDPARLGAADVLEVCAAQARQVAHEQARLLALMLQAGYAARASEPDSLWRGSGLDEFSGDEVAFSLCCSRGYAFGQLLLAADLIERLPAVYAALAAGGIDIARARCFAEALAELDEATARALAGRLLERATRWTPAQLRERLRYHALRADPGLARRHRVRDQPAPRPGRRRHRTPQRPGIGGPRRRR
jgi:hypothetical protein